MKYNIYKEFNNYKKNKSATAAPRYSSDKYIKLYQESYAKLVEHMQNAPMEYKTYLESINYYLFFSNMFTTVQDSFIVLKDGSMRFSTSKDFFTYLSTLSTTNLNINFGNTYFNKLYRLYYSYLKSYSSIPSPYNRYIATIYKNCIRFPYLYNIFMNPHSFFIYINKEIAFTDPYLNYKGFGIQVIKMLLNHCDSPKKFIPLLKMLPKVIDNSSFHTSAPCCSSNYSFNFYSKGNSFYAYFNNGKIKYEKNNNEYITNLTLINLDNYTQISCAQSWFDILYDITGGIKQNLNNFAILFSLIKTNYYKNIYYTLPSKNCSPISLYIVYAPQEQAKAIHYWLENILFTSSTESDYQLKDIIKTKNLLELIQQNYNFPTYIPVHPSKSKESETQIKTIKKLIQRKEITVKDSYGLNHTLINQLPVICFVDNLDQLRWLQANFKTKTFTFKPVQTTYSATYELKKRKDLVCSLSIYGLKLLYDSNFKYKTNNNSHIKTENITENFINDCLKFEENYSFYADDLYDLYVNYYHLIYGNTPLTKICFTKEMKKLLPCQYKKPRHSRSDNRYAFIGINIDEEKALKLVKRTDNLRKDINKQSFTNYILDMQDTVNDVLQSLHNNIYKE